jgi:uncharacterized membrane protein YbhN (UPF0104 family)
LKVSAALPRNYGNNRIARAHSAYMFMKRLFEKKRISVIFKILITVMFMVIVNRSITREELVVIARYLSMTHLGVALMLGMAGLWFQVQRWEIILRYQEFSVKGMIAWKTLLWGNLLAFITPGRFGELFRGIRINEHRKGDSLFAVIIDKLFIIIMVFGFGFVCMVLQAGIFHVGLTFIMKVFLVVAVVFCTLGFVLLSTGKVFDRKHAVSRYFNHVLVNLPRLFTPAGRRALLYSFGAHICLVLQTVLLLRMFGCGTFFVNSIAVGQAYGIMPFLSVTIGNMGVREFSFRLFLSGLGAECTGTSLTVGSAALGTSVIILLMNIIIPAFAGLLWYLFDTTTGRNLREGV